MTTSQASPAGPVSSAEQRSQAKQLVQDEILTKDQLAELLHVSIRTIERWILENRVPFVALPKRGDRGNIRFLRSTILHWLKRNEQKASNKLLREEFYDEEY